MGVKNINKDLLDVIAEGCCVVWGAADLRFYAKNEETTIMRLMDQYGLDPCDARTIAKTICKIGLHRSRRQDDVWEIESERAKREEEEARIRRMKREI